MIFEIGDLDHSEMFPYAIKLVKELGAKKIYIEPHVHGFTPDVIGEIAKDQFLVVECDAHQPTCRNHIRQFRGDEFYINMLTSVLFLEMRRTSRL